MKVSVRFLSQDRAVVYFSTMLDVADDAWTETKFEFPAPRTDPGARMEITFEGKGHLSIGMEVCQKCARIAVTTMQDCSKMPPVAVPERGIAASGGELDIIAF